MPNSNNEFNPYDLEDGRCRLAEAGIEPDQIVELEKIITTVQPETNQDDALEPGLPLPIMRAVMGFGARLRCTSEIGYKLTGFAKAYHIYLAMNRDKAEAEAFTNEFILVLGHLPREEVIYMAARINTVCDELKSIKDKRYVRREAKQGCRPGGMRLNTEETHARITYFVVEGILRPGNIIQNPSKIHAWQKIDEILFTTILPYAVKKAIKSRNIVELKDSIEKNPIFVDNTARTSLLTYVTKLEIQLD